MRRHVAVVAVLLSLAAPAAAEDALTLDVLVRAKAAEVRASGQADAFVATLEGFLGGDPSGASIIPAPERQRVLAGVRAILAGDGSVVVRG